MAAKTAIDVSTSRADLKAWQTATDDDEAFQALTPAEHKEVVDHYTVRWKALAPAERQDADRVFA